MQITSVKPFSIKSYNNNNYKFSNNTISFRASTIGDAFTKKSLPLDKLKNFTIREYRRLSPSEVDSINKMIDESFWITHDKLKFFEYLNYHDLAATSIQNTLEDKYGAGNFVVIPIGRSLSSIGKCLGLKIGEDNVKPLPMSISCRFVDMERRNEQVGAFKRYLWTIGLSKNRIMTSGKMYIFTDFCCTGASLCGAENLFRSEKIYGDLDNIEFINVYNLLSNIKQADTLEKLKNALYGSEFKRYSLVDKCRVLFNTRNAVIKPENYTREAKYFYFKLLDNEMKKH